MYSIDGFVGFVYSGNETLKKNICISIYFDGALSFKINDRKLTVAHFKIHNLHPFYIRFC